MFECNICSKSFDDLRQLNGHKSVHVDYIRGGQWNSRKRKIESTRCQCCEREYTRSKNTLGKYCSLQCQKDHYAKLRLAEVATNQPSSAKWIKRYLIETNGPTCMDPNCAWDQNARPVAVELEHIDGNGSNHVLSNCKLLCPCCHSLTPTYKGKNRGNGRKRRMDRYYEDKRRRNSMS